MVEIDDMEGMGEVQGSQVPDPMRPISQDGNPRVKASANRRSPNASAVSMAPVYVVDPATRRGNPLCIGARLGEDASQLRLSGPGAAASLLTLSAGGFSFGCRNAGSIIRNVQNRDRFIRRSNRTCHSLCPDTLFPALDVRPYRLGNPFRILRAEVNPRGLRPRQKNLWPRYGPSDGGLRVKTTYALYRAGHPWGRGGHRNGYSRRDRRLFLPEA